MRLISCATNHIINRLRLNNKQILRKLTWYGYLSMVVDWPPSIWESEDAATATAVRHSSRSNMVTIVDDSQLVTEMFIRKSNYRYATSRDKMSISWYDIVSISSESFMRAFIRAGSLTRTRYPKWFGNIRTIRKDSRARVRDWKSK